MYSFQAFYRVVKVPGTVADPADPDCYADLSFFDYWPIVFAAGRCKDHVRMEDINLADASKEFYTSGLHVLQICSVVYVSRDVNVAKLYWQPNTEFRLQRSFILPIRRISYLAGRPAAGKLNEETATDLFTMITFQASGTTNWRSILILR